MIFQNLTVFQNILFWLACIGVFLSIVYVVLTLTQYIKPHKQITSDDIDNPNEDYQTSHFIFNALTIKGSIYLLAIFSTFSFAFSLLLPLWIAIVIGAVLGLGIAIVMKFFDREPLADKNDIAIVSQRIPANNEGSGKVILQESGAEITAISTGKAIRKGKKVIIIENKDNIVKVERIKKWKKKNL